MEFNGKNIVYVGGFGGIGQAVCRELLQKNIVKNLIILDVQLNETAFAELQTVNPNVKIHFEAIDLTKGLDHCRSVWQSVVDNVQHVDVLVNGSGIADESQQEQMIQINFAGLIHTSTAAFEHWHAQGKGGRIVNIASILGLEPFMAIPVYAATKAGVIQFSRALAGYQTRTGISVIAICPGFTNTEILTTAKPFIKPSSENNFSTTVGKQILQSPEELASHFVDLLMTAENGSVWHIVGGKRTQVTMPSFPELHLSQ